MSSGEATVDVQEERARWRMHMTGWLVLAENSAEAEPGTWLSREWYGLSHTMMTGFKSKCSERQEVEAARPVNVYSKKWYSATPAVFFIKELTEPHQSLGGGE